MIADEKAGSRRLPEAERRRQLLDTALLIVREEGADRLTLDVSPRAPASPSPSPTIISAQDRDD